jgi:large subunit ribosomal protein L19
MNRLSVFQSNNARGDKFEGMKPGWTVKVFQKIKEGEKTRVQAFEGMIMSRKHNREAGATVTVRKVSGGVGVEKTYPIYLPTIDKVTVIKKAKVRKSKLYYLKDKSAREIRRKTKVETEKAAS